MEYRGIPVGTHVLSGMLNESREYEFTHQFTQMTATNVVLRVTQTLRFATDPPHHLLHANSMKQVLPDETPYEVAVVTRDDGMLSVQRDGQQLAVLASDYTLDEYLSLDSWLASTDLEIGASNSARVLNLDRATLSSRTWSITELTQKSITVRSSDQIESKFVIGKEGIQLARSESESGLVLRPVSDTLDPEPETSIPTSAPVRVPLDSSLQRPRQLSMLELKATFANEDPGPWRSLMTAEGTLRIQRGKPMLQSNRASKEDPSWLRENSTFSEVRKLAEQTLDGFVHEEEKVSALVGLVHEYISYEPSDKPKSVMSTLQDRRGDCSDIANVMSSLAHSFGLNVSTVYGLAYDQNTQTFQMHAWNMFHLSNNSLRTVDATWNQPQADATHIEFPDSYLHEVLQSLENMTLSVVRYEHDDA